MHSLEQLSIQGFRSIKELKDFKLGPITVLVGPNGAGKSNLILFFRMMNYIMSGGLQVFLEEWNHASTVLHISPKQTRFIDASLTFRSNSGLNTYNCELTFAAIDRLMFTREECQFLRNGSQRAIIIPIQNDAPSESALSRYLNPETQRTPIFIRNFLKNARVFHFHDTSATSRMRNYCDSTENLYLRSDGGNLAAILLRLREEYSGNYRRIVSGVNTVFPELDDFVLDLQDSPKPSLLLRWKPSSHPTDIFGPLHLSDGTLRMIALVTLFNLPETMAPWMIVLDEPELGLHPAAEAYFASLIRSASTQTQVMLSTQSATLVDHFKPEEVVVVETHNGASSFTRLEDAKLGDWLKRYTLGEAWRKNVFGGRPE